MGFYYWRISRVGGRLEMPSCQSHICVCGSLVDVLSIREEKWKAIILWKRIGFCFVMKLLAGKVHIVREEEWKKKIFLWEKVAAGKVHIIRGKKGKIYFSGKSCCWESTLRREKGVRKFFFLKICCWESTFIIIIIFLKIEVESINHMTCINIV